MRVVPTKYESNSRNKRDLEQERKLNALIREFTEKYRDISSLEEIKLFRQRLIAVKSLTPRKKGQREAAAVVAYLGMKEEIKLSIR
jgi:cellulose biosynthesis protein BcsQ